MAEGGYEERVEKAAAGAVLNLDSQTYHGAYGVKRDGAYLALRRREINNAARKFEVGVGDLLFRITQYELEGFETCTKVVR